MLPPETIHKATTVFGISRELPLNYIEREGVDDKLMDNLTRDQHIVIFGSSKQGKTSLRKHCLKEDDYITVSCQNNLALRDLHAAILKAAGYTIKAASSRAADGNAKIEASFEARLELPSLGSVGGKVGAGRDTKVSNTETSKRLELDVGDPNDIIMALEEINFRKFIVLEDFHYLPQETQQSFSYALKAFHEKSDKIKITFIIVAVWREENRLILFNGDLTGRVIPIDADAWNKEQLAELIRQGEILLNCQFGDKFKKGLIDQSLESVYIVQESCNRACRDAKVFETSQKHIEILLEKQAADYIREIVNDQSGRYKFFLQNFALGFQKSELEMYKWLIYPVLKSTRTQLEKGLRYSDISSLLRSKHPLGVKLNPGNLTQALQQVSSLQIKKNIKPFVLDYDSSNLLLSVVDKGFIVWLAAQDISSLCELVDLPKD
ncbi:MAG: hypothetical protein ING10_03810 [Roseomonas sp.]|nr:hypothetical protein [Roseomonas sp.]